MQTWAISLFPAGVVKKPIKGTKDFRTVIGPTVLPRARHFTWRDLVLLLTDFRRYPPYKGLPSDPKERVDCWSPASYPGWCVRRKKADVEAVSCLVLDYDDGTTIGEAAQVWGDWTHIGHTSWSHSEGHHKFRIVLPLARPVPGEQWERAWTWAMDTWKLLAPAREGGAICGTPDQKCRDQSRIYFLPALRAGQGDRYAWSRQGGWGWLDIPWESVPPAPPPPPIQPLRPVQVGSWQARQECQRRLNEEPAARLALGHALGGSVSEDKVRHVKCPSCGEKSVWWLIRPKARRTAACNHRDSCGQWFWLYDLALLHGAAEAA